MKRLLTWAALVAAFFFLTPAAPAQAASPSNTYCSSDSGVTWLPCAGSGGGGGGTSVTPSQASFTNRSGAITTGGTAQTLEAITATRKRIVIENPCTAASQNIVTAENLFLNFTSAASVTAASIELLPCGSYDTGIGPVSTELISVVATTTAHKYTAKIQE